MSKGIVRFVLELVLGAGVIMLMSYIFDGVYVRDFSIAFLVAIVLSLLNKFVKPILSVLALPITIMSLGLFQLVINGVILYIAVMVLKPDFQIASFGLTILTAICISILYSILGIGKD